MIGLQAHCRFVRLQRLIKTIGCVIRFTQLVVGGGFVGVEGHGPLEGLDRITSLRATTQRDSKLELRICVRVIYLRRHGPTST